MSLQAEVNEIIERKDCSTTIFRDVAHVGDLSIKCLLPKTTGKNKKISVF